MLGHLGSRRRRHQRRAGGDVEGQRSTAAGAHHVHQLGALLGGKGHRLDALAHHLHKPGQFRRVFAARGQHSQQRRSLHIRHFARENQGQGVGRLFAGQGRAILGQRFQ